VFEKSDTVFPMLLDIVSSVTLNDEAEVKLLHLLLIEKMQTAAFPELPPERKIALFRRAIKEVKSRPLLHHLAKLQMDSGRLEDADKTLKESLKTFLRGFDERKENVLDSMARLELRLAEQKAIQKEEKESWSHLDKAEELFQRACINPPETPHPYQGLGKTYLAKARLSPDEETRISYLLLALKEYSYADSNGDPQSMLAWESVRSDAFDQLDAMGFDEEKASRIVRYLGGGNGYAFLAQREMDRNNFDHAMKLVDKGLSGDTKSLWLVRLKARLVRILFPEDYSELMGVLERYLPLVGQRFDIVLSYEFAMVTFKLGKFKTSARAFQQLYSTSRFHPDRVTPSEMNRWTEGGRPKEFHGVMRRAPTAFERGDIECTSLPDYRGTIAVWRKDVEFEPHGNDKVAFSIIFNMLGPQASRVRKYA